MMQATVRIEGADQALRALRVMEPETAKEVGREVSGLGKMLAGSARGKAPGGVPMSGWRYGTAFPLWSNPTIVSSRRGMEARVKVTNSPGAIFESAGTRMGAPTQRTAQFVDNLNRYGSPVQGSAGKAGRMVRAAVVENYGQVWEGIRKACDRAVDAVNRRMP
jgi:hypothetical protein